MAITVQFQVEDAVVLFALKLGLFSLVTIEEGLIRECARLIAGQQYGCLALANAAINKIGISIIRRCVHIDLNAGQGNACTAAR